MRRAHIQVDRASLRVYVQARWYLQETKGCRRRRLRVPLSPGSPVPGDPPGGFGAVLRPTVAQREARERIAAVSEPRGSGLRVPPRRGGSVLISIASPIEHKGLGALGQAFGDDLGVEGVGEDLGPVRCSHISG
jgi:hypothetical protein